MAAENVNRESVVVVAGQHLPAAWSPHPALERRRKQSSEIDEGEFRPLVQEPSHDLLVLFRLERTGRGDEQPPPRNLGGRAAQQRRGLGRQPADLAPAQAPLELRMAS